MYTTFADIITQDIILRIIDRDCVMELSLDCELPAGVSIQPLVNRPDHRGDLTEIYRAEWMPPSIIPIIQWNYVRSHAGVLRGVHIHRKHTDYLILLEGKMLLGLRDVRIHSPTEGMSFVLTLTPSQPRAIIIPPGVMHGFYFPQSSVLTYGVNTYWDPKDEDGCHWADPDLGIPWQIKDAIVSERDKNAPSFKTLMNNIDPFIYTDFK